MSEEQHKRQFTGVFIPAEVLTDERLSATDKIMLAEIDALRGEDGGGCYASNAYLGKIVGVSASRAKAIITKLRELDYIETVGFDGRTRRLRVSGRLADSLFSGRQTDCGQAGRQTGNRPIERIDRIIKEKERAPAFVIPEFLKTPEFIAAWENFVADRKERRVPVTIRAGHMLLTELAKRPKHAVAALVMAIKKGWRGFEWNWFDNATAKEQPKAPATPISYRNKRINTLNQRKVALLRMAQTPQVRQELEKIRIELSSL